MSGTVLAALASDGTLWLGRTAWVRSSKTAPEMNDLQWTWSQIEALPESP